MLVKIRLRGCFNDYRLCKSVVDGKVQFLWFEILHAIF